MVALKVVFAENLASKAASHPLMRFKNQPGVCIFVTHTVVRFSKTLYNMRHQQFIYMQIRESDEAFHLRCRPFALAQDDNA